MPSDGMPWLGMRRVIGRPLLMLATAGLVGCGSPSSSQASPAGDAPPSSSTTSAPTAPDPQTKPTPKRENTPVKDAAPAPDFQAARKAFTDAAAVVGDLPAGELNIYPETPGDRFDRRELAELRTGDLLAFRATTARDTVLRAFADAEGAARVSDGLLATLRSGGRIDSAEPGLARLFAAGRVGLDDGMSYSDLKKRLKFLFHDEGRFERMCPIEREGDAVRLRWKLSVLGEGGNTPRGPKGPGIQKTNEVWLTARYTPGSGTARVTSGEEGC